MLGFGIEVLRRRTAWQAGAVRPGNGAWRMRCAAGRSSVRCAGRSCGVWRKSEIRVSLVGGKIRWRSWGAARIVMR
jgi:hypothetical protein